MAQHLNADGSTDGPVIQVSDGQTNDQLSDVSGNRIVYTAFESDFTLMGQIKLYDLSTATTYEIMSQADVVREARIDRDIVVCDSGNVFFTESVDTGRLRRHPGQLPRPGLAQRHNAARHRRAQSGFA